MVLCVSPSVNGSWISCLFPTPCQYQSAAKHMVSLSWQVNWFQWTRDIGLTLATLSPSSAKRRCACCDITSMLLVWLMNQSGNQLYKISTSIIRKCISTQQTFVCRLIIDRCWFLNFVVFTIILSSRKCRWSHEQSIPFPRHDHLDTVWHAEQNETLSFQW